MQCVEIGTEIKQIVEALLFATNQPLSFKKILSVVNTHSPISAKELRVYINELANELKESERSFQLDEIAHGFLLRSKPEFGVYVGMLERKKQDRLTQAAAEVLSVIAYKQPITRAEVEAIRGVDCTNQIHNLLDRELVEAKGKLEVPGRPTLYGVTNQFLLHFGLKDIKELKSKL